MNKTMKIESVLDRNNPYNFMYYDFTVTFESGENKQAFYRALNCKSEIDRGTSKFFFSSSRDSHEKIVQVYTVCKTHYDTKAKALKAFRREVLDNQRRRRNF